MTKYCIVYCTVPNQEVADKVTEKVVGERLSPCVSIIPGLVSVYRWKGSVCRDNELLLVMKTKVELFEKLSSAIKEVHSYEVPEIIAVPISAGAETYLSWIDENVGIQK